MQRETENSIITVGSFNIPLSVIERSIRQKIQKDIVELRSTINRLDLTDIYRERSLRNPNGSVTVEHLLLTSSC